MQEQVQQTTLQNGLVIITEFIPTVRSVSGGIWVKTGSRYETAEQAGITHFLEHMLFKGTKTRSAFDIVSAIEARGGYLNAFTSNEYTAYYVRCLDTELLTAIDVLSDMVLNSTFPAEELEKEKKVVIEEMKMYRDSPEDYVFEEFLAQIYNGHPLGRPIIGFENTVNAFNRDQLYAFMDTHYRADNLIMAFAGNVNHDEVVKHMEAYFGEHPTGTQVSRQEIIPEYVKRESKLEKEIEQTHLVLGRRSLSSSDPDRFKLLLMNMILGGGMSSRLHQNVREKYGYCYTINSSIQSFYDTGFFAIYTGTDEEYVEHVKELVFTELDEMASKLVPEQELQNSKTQLKGMLLLGQENMSNRMTRLAKSEMYYNRYVPLDEIERDIDAVTAEDLHAFCAEFLKNELFTETVLIPSNND